MACRVGVDSVGVETATAGKAPRRIDANGQGSAFLGGAFDGAEVLLQVIPSRPRGHADKDSSSPSPRLAGQSGEALRRLRRKEVRSKVKKHGVGVNTIEETIRAVQEEGRIYRIFEGGTDCASSISSTSQPRGQYRGPREGKIPPNAPSARH